MQLLKQQISVLSIIYLSMVSLQQAEGLELGMDWEARGCYRLG